MSNLLHVRCSALGRIDACPPSALPPRDRIDAGSEAADFGNAVHLYAVGSQDSDIQGLAHGVYQNTEELAAEYDVDHADLDQTCGWLRWLFATRLKHWFPDPFVTEHAMRLEDPRGILLTGSMDLGSQPEREEVRVCDFKSGRLDIDPTPQLRGYGWLAIQDSDAKRVRAICVSTRRREAQVWLWTREELERWWHNLAAKILHETSRPDMTYRPGEGCRFCPRWHECTAGKGLIRQHADSLVEMTGMGDLSDFTPEDIIRLHERLKQVGSVAERVGQLVKAYVQAAGGEVTAADGTRLVIAEQPKVTIEYGPAQDTLLAAIGQEVCECVKVSKGKVLKKLSAKYPRGQKGTAIKQLMGDLAAAGALTTTFQEKLLLKKSHQEIEVKQ